MSRPLAAAFIIAAALVAPTVASAVRMPVSSGFCRRVAVRPAEVTFGADGSSYLAGYRSRPHRCYVTGRSGRLRWTTWNDREGRAWGGLWVDDGKPTIGTGTMHPYRANVHVFRPRGGVFTRMVVTLRRSVPFFGRRVTFRANDVAGGFACWTQ